MTGHDLGGGSGEAAGLEARVVADQDGAAGVVLREHAAGGVGDAAERLVGEVVADDRAPAVSTEVNVSGHGSGSSSGLCRVNSAA